MTALRDQTIALAALYQAIQTIDTLARTGSALENDIHTCINSLFIFDAPNTESIYGSIMDLKSGLTGLVKQLNGESYRDEENQSNQSANKKTNLHLAQYAIGVMHLQKKLAKDKKLLETVTARLEVAQRQSELFSSTLHSNVLANIADIYSDSISTLAAKIMIQGEQSHLSNPSIVNKIRSLLLAAVRAAILWNQLGGRRWHIIFRRNKILEMAKNIVNNEIPQHLN